MDSEVKPHAVLTPFPLQGHLNSMLRLAKVLHYKGFHITFVNTEYNHKRLLKTRGPNALHGLPGFCFETIPDGGPPTDADPTDDNILYFCDPTGKNCLDPFRELLAKLNDSATAGVIPPVTCLVSDGIMTFTIKAAQEIGVPSLVYFPASAYSYLCMVHISSLLNRGLIPLKGTIDVLSSNNNL